MEQVIEVGSIWIGKINRQTELEVMSFNSEKVKVKVLSNGSDVSSVDVIFYMTKDYFLNSYARQVSMEYLKVYEEGRKFGYSDAVEEYNTNLAEIKKYHYDMGYNDALTHMASEEAEKEVVANNEGYDKGFDDGYNKAIEEMKVDKLNSGVCGSNVPNKETQEAMQEVLDKDSNEFAGTWVAKDGSGKLKVLSVDEGDCDVELAEHVSNYYLCVGDTANISVDDLKEHWTKEKPVDKEAKHNHYRKSVEHLDYIDIYRVCKLFKVKDDSHCLHHSIKKLLMSGQRGAGKSKIQDITEARDSLNSYLENEELFKGYSND